MWRALISIIAIAGASSSVAAQTITDPSEVVSHLKLWTQETGDPVYYGEVRDVDARSKRVGGHYQCLALAFIKYDGGVLQYAHKMWSKSRDGSCHYDDVTSRKVGNHGACVKDSNAGFGKAVGTARMTKDNIDYEHSTFRTVDLNTRRVGETKSCIPPRGASAGLYSMRIVNGRFQIITTRPLAYEVNIEPQDPHNPPTKPVF
ncbi:hypothetical protein [Nitrobacter sp. TKz-YC02]|uniref:hypothetical protein n=1 Tax=Nitrobacter sp. TKz-YC02 TaxID=3398704 RepID=UPI003CEF3262